MTSDLSRYYGHSTDHLFGGCSPTIARGFYEVPYREQSWRDNCEWTGEFPAEVVREMMDDSKRGER